MRNSDRYGRAERQLRARARRLETKERYETGAVSAEPPRLYALADEAERQRYEREEKSIDLDERIEAALGQGWDEGPEPEVWQKR